MLKGLLKLSWIETKIFLREPMGVVGTLFMPLVFFLIMARFLRGVPRPIRRASDDWRSTRRSSPRC